MTSDEATQRLREARSRLWSTLAEDGVKLNNSPDENETVVEYRDISEIIKLNQSKALLRQTLSGGRIKQAAAPDVATETATWASEKTGRQIVSEVPAGAVQKLDASKAQLKKTLAGAFTKSRARDELVATMQKQNRCPYADDNSTGKSDITKDSPITPSGTPFVGRYGYITVRNGRITLDQLLAEEQDKADEDSPSSSVTSGQDGTSDWTPREHADDFDSEDDEEFNPEKESAAILQMYTSSDGQIRKHAKKYFLNVNGDGTEASHYAVPLARMNKVSMQPDYDSDAIDEAFAMAAGRDSGLANYSAMSRLVRLKQREGMELNDAQRDHSVRHMGPMYTPVPTREEREDAVLKTMRR